MGKWSNYSQGQDFVCQANWTLNWWMPGKLTCGAAKDERLDNMHPCEGSGSGGRGACARVPAFRRAGSVQPPTAIVDNCRERAAPRLACCRRSMWHLHMQLAPAIPPCGSAQSPHGCCAHVALKHAEGSRSGARWQLAAAGLCISTCLWSHG